jgi:hypothetical protein
MTVCGSSAHERFAMLTSTVQAPTLHYIQSRQTVLKLWQQNKRQVPEAFLSKYTRVYLHPNTRRRKLQQYHCLVTGKLRALIPG